jgi:ABC-type dipeptide/oligopeptide/nickel transport system permease component
VRRKIRDHLLSLLVVAATFAVAVSFAGRDTDIDRRERERLVEPFLQIEGLDPGDPLHRALLREALGAAYPGRPEHADSVMRSIELHQIERFTTASLKTGAQQPGLTGPKVLRILPMYAEFVLVYLVALVLTYYGAKTIGTYRFIRPRREFGLASFPGMLLRLAAYAVLFSPAYVIAYALKTTVDTGSIPFMILLAVVSNGLLITYANRFETFLTQESRQGYVETAMVKGLQPLHEAGKHRIRLSAVLQPVKRFRGHVFQHVYMNARYQYIPTVKEQASFMITGLIIIEMALNIQGRLGYELLQNVLYRDYQVVAFIIIAIFAVVKVTEIIVDLWHQRETRRFENRPG